MMNRTSIRGGNSPLGRWLVTGTFALAIVGFFNLPLVRGQSTKNEDPKQPAPSKDQPADKPGDKAPGQPADKPADKPNTGAEKPATPAEKPAAPAPDKQAPITVLKPKEAPAGDAGTTPPSGGDAKAEGAPVFKIDQTDHDFGDVWTGPPLKHSFIVKNEGTGTLQILSVKPSCGCTVANTYTKEIPAGGQGEIPLTIDSKKVHDKFTKSVTITTNDPANQQVRVNLSGHVKMYIEVEPSFANFGKVIDVTSPLERTVSIKSNTDKPLELKFQGADTDGKFKASLVEKVPGKEFDLVIKGQPPYDAKYNRGAFRISTNVPDQALLTINAMANVVPIIEAMPEEMIIPTETAGPQKFPRTVRIMNNGEKLIKVTEVSVDDPALAATSLVRTEGKMYDIQLTIPEKYEVPAEGRTILVKTDDPANAELKIPIRKQPPRPPTPTPESRYPSMALIGKPAPSEKMTTAAGATVDTDGDGKVMVLDFYATWCPHCKRQLPVVEKVYQQFKDNKDVKFVAVSQDVDDGTPRGRKPEQVAQTIKELGVTFDYVLDSQKAAGNAFKAFSFPHLILVGKDGTVQAVRPGSGLTEAQLKGDVEKLLAGKTLIEAEQAAKPTVLAPKLKVADPSVQAIPEKK